MEYTTIQANTWILGYTFSLLDQNTKQFPYIGEAQYTMTTATIIEIFNNTIPIISDQKD